jgi:hypothetical protein
MIDHVITTILYGQLERVDDLNLSAILCAE